MTLLIAIDKYLMVLDNDLKIVMVVMVVIVVDS